MRLTRVLFPFLTVLVMVFAARSANAGVCWGYSELDPEECVGHECMDSWTPTYCSFGCVSGTCDNQGNSTECCGTSHYVAQIYPDGDSCKDQGCGESGLFRFHTKTPLVNSQHSAELRQGYSPGLVMLSANVSYKPARLIYVYNRCSRSFKLIIEDERIITTGGM